MACHLCLPVSGWRHFLDCVISFAASVPVTSRKLQQGTQSRWPPTAAPGSTSNFSLQPHKKYCITQYEELGFSWLSQMKDDYTTGSQFLAHIFLFNRLGECTFCRNLGVEVKRIARDRLAWTLQNLAWLYELRFVVQTEH